MHRVRCGVTVACVLTALASGHAMAADAESLATRGAAPGVVTLDLATTVRLALAHSPTLRPSRAAVTGAGVVASAVDTALATPPRIEVQAGPRFQHGSLPTKPEVTVAAWQDLSLGSFGSARRALSASIAREAAAGLRAAELDAAARGALAWIDARLAVELERLRTESLRDAEELERLADARVRSGRADSGESALAQA